MFRKFQSIAQVYRPWYKDDSWYSKSDYTDTGNSYDGHLKAETVDKVNDISMFWKVFAFHTKKEADIKASDRLVIDWTNYDVQGVSDYKWISIDMKQCLVYKAD